MSGMSENSARSWPTQKPRPAPVMTTARTCAASASRSASRSAACIDASNAFSLSGRLRVIVSTEPARLVSTVSDTAWTLLQEPPRSPVAEHRPQSQDRGERDELTHERDLRRVHGRLPADALALDDPRAGRPRRDAEAAAAVPRGVPAASAAPADLRGRDDGDAVLLVRLAVDPLRGHDVLRAREYLLDVHLTLLPWSRPSLQ